ncbi:uncharacterized protein OCT59_021871 [Rhizophagus irregularis]|uniref:uncharacterized protein n=1 Tax=Rhizophagus irregularis TaxID=588596 RepID=UPI00331FCA44|nr:hypothetical protein OCT59_021871 [Rhizophagus irregularis]
MQVHLNDSCPEPPESAKTKKQQIPELLETSDATTSTFIPTVKTSKKHLKNTTIENFVDRMSEEEQDTLEILLAQALFAAGVPFSFLENNYVIQFFQQLRPAFKLPNRRKLADELLDDVFDEVKAECNEQILQAKSLTMVSDGWSNINRESVQNFVICTPKPLFFDAIYSGEESHTAKWVADEIIKFKWKLLKQISNFNENEEDSNNSSDNENKEDDNNNSSDNDSIFGFEANVINLDDEE